MYLLVYLFTIVLFYFFGKIYLEFFFSQELERMNLNFYKEVAINLFIGIVLCTILTAVSVTYFRTTFLLPFIVFCIVPFFKKREPFSIKSFIFTFKEVGIVFGISVLVFLYHFYLFFDSSKLPFYDFLFLGKISSGLFAAHIENTHVSYHHFESNSVQMIYHYIDLWLTGLIHYFTNLSEARILLNIVFPIFHFSILMLCISIFFHFSKSIIISFIGGFGLLYGIKFFIPIQTTSDSFLELVSTYRGLPFAMFFKLSIIYMLSLMAYLLYLNDLKKYAFIIFAFVTLFYPTTIPAMGFIAVTLIFYQFVKKLFFKKAMNRDIIFLSSFILGIILFMVVFQKLFQFEAMNKFALEVYPIKTYIVFFVEMIIKVVIEHILIIFLFIYFIIQRKFKVLAFNPIVILGLLGLIGSYIFVYSQSLNVLDNNQIINNFSPVLMLLICIDILKSASEKLIYKIALITFLIGMYNLSFNCWNRPDKLRSKNEVHSDFFIHEVQKVLEKSSNKNSCSITNYQPQRWSYNTNNVFNFVLLNPNINTPLEIGILLSKDFNNYVSSNLNYPPSSFFKNRKVTNSSILGYLREYKVNYVLIEKSLIHKLDQIVDYDVIVKDSRTKNCLLQLNLSSNKI